MDSTRRTGYLYGVLTAACWATSPVFIRKGLADLPSPLWGTTVGLVAATAIYSIWLTWRRGWRRLDEPVKVAIGFQALAGIAAGVGTIARTTSIELAPIVVAIPLTQTASLFTLIYAPLLLGRQVERVTVKLAFGAVCVVAGSALVIVGQTL